jgi:hypothetical protein
MPTELTDRSAADVPARVFQEFIKDLEAASMPSDVVARLRKTLLEEKNITERALRAAVLGEGQ